MHILNEINEILLCGSDSFRMTSRGGMTLNATVTFELATSFAYICIHHPVAHQLHCDGTEVALGNLGIAGRHRRF